MWAVYDCPNQTIHAIRTILSDLIRAVIDCRHNPSIAVVYQRLRHSGKRPKVAITACMRKLLTILNAIARDRVSWRQELPCA